MIENEEEIWDLLSRFNVNKLAFKYNKYSEKVKFLMQKNARS